MPTKDTNTREGNQVTTQVDKATAKVVTEEIQEAVAAILAKHNLQPGKINFGYGDYYEIKVQAHAIELGLNGVNTASKYATYYTKFGWVAYGDNGEAQQLTAPLGTKFTYNNREVIFAGIDSAKRKFPIVVTDAQTGEIRLLTEAAIQRINLAGQVAK